LKAFVLKSKVPRLFVAYDFSWQALDLRPGELLQGLAWETICDVSQAQLRILHLLSLLKLLSIR